MLRLYHFPPITLLEKLEKDLCELSYDYMMIR